MTGTVQPHTWQQFLEQHRLDRRPVYALGFNPHWRKTLARFTQGSTLKHVRTVAGVPRGAVVLVWGQRPVDLPHGDIVLVRLEDGFLRSVGLGAEFAKPVSWVADFGHLYFDATGPSRLETLLQNHPFTAQETQRAAGLIERINQAGLSKYNTGSQLWQRPDKANVILVPGQVESDASLAFGAPGIRGNMALLQAVRKHNPNAWVVYKPHPDVLAGARKQGAGEYNAQKWCNEIVTNVSIASVLGQVDEVHTLTSLAGFEALLRNKNVTCYGLPFYAGWGLTKDQQPCQRRNRQLSLEELAYAVLVHYPWYTSPATGRFITPEQALEELAAMKQQTPTAGNRFGKMARKAINLMAGAK